MWTTLDGYRISISPCRLLRTVIRMKRDPFLWKRLSRSFISRLRPTALRFIGRMAQDAVLNREDRARRLRRFVTHVDGRDYEFVTQIIAGREGAMLAIQPVSASQNPSRNRVLTRARLGGRARG